MAKMAIYTLKCTQKLLKINNRGGGVGIKISWVEKYRKINNRGGGDYSRLESSKAPEPFAEHYLKFLK